MIRDEGHWLQLTDAFHAAAIDPDRWYGALSAFAGASVFADPESAVDVTDEAVPGRYYQFGIGDETSANANLKGFRLRFDADFMGEARETGRSPPRQRFRTTH